jgi:hypothetical protein
MWKVFLQVPMPCLKQAKRVGNGGIQFFASGMREKSNGTLQIGNGDPKGYSKSGIYSGISADY